MLKEKIELDKELVRKSAEHVLETTRVPGRHFLKIATALKNTLTRHEADRTSWRETTARVSAYFKQHNEDRAKHLAEIAELQKRHAEEMRGLKEGHTKVFEDQGREVARIQKIKEGKPGLPGKDADHEKIVSMLITRNLVPKGDKGDDGDDAEFDKEKLFEEFMTRIVKGKLIKAEHVQGMSGWVRDGVKYRFEELMHGGGGGVGSRSGVVPTGTIPGSTFTLPFTPNSSLKVYLDGARAKLTTDYTVSGKVITTTFPVTTSILCDD